MDYEAVLNQAYDAADAAIKVKFDKGDREQPFNCGFAWVTVAGNTAFANHCRNVRKRLDPMMNRGERRYGDKGYPRGWQFWEPGSWPKNAPDQYQQDMDFHLAGARAFANVLESYGIRASVGHRLD